MKNCSDVVVLMQAIIAVLFRLINTLFKSFTDQVCEREINLQRSESGKLLDSQRRDSRSKLIETARLLRNVRNVFRRPNASSEAARQTELELSRNSSIHPFYAS